MKTLIKLSNYVYVIKHKMYLQYIIFLRLFAYNKISIFSIFFFSFTVGHKPHVCPSAEGTASAPLLWKAEEHMATGQGG